MASFVKINSFVEKVAEKTHNLGSDQLKIALTNSDPTETANVLANITEISYTNLSGATPRNITTSSSSQTSGTYKLVVADLTLSATGAVGPFQYVVVYNDTATNKDIIGYYNYGSSVTLQNGDSFVIDFDQSNGLLTIV